jgi:hypothetical protein
MIEFVLNDSRQEVIDWACNFVSLQIVSVYIEGFASEYMCIDTGQRQAAFFRDYSSLRFINDRIYEDHLLFFFLAVTRWIGHKKSDGQRDLVCREADTPKIVHDLEHLVHQIVQFRVDPHDRLGLMPKNWMRKSNELQFCHGEYRIASEWVRLINVSAVAAEPITLAVNVRVYCFLDQPLRKPRMNLVSSFFFRRAVLGIWGLVIIWSASHCVSQDFAPQIRRGADDATSESTATYRKALETFGGPTLVRVAVRERSDLGIWTVASTVEEQGIILDWNEEKLTLLRSDSDEPTSIVTRNVYQITHTFRPSVLRELQDNYGTEKFQEVLASAPMVIGSKAEGIKLSRWEQKYVLSMLIESCKALDRWDLACTLFVSLAKESPPDLLAATIPIPWFDSVAEVRDRDKIRSKAALWLNESNELLQLLGACWLLDGELRSEAINSLKKLSRETKHPLVGPFASAQLWRTTPPAEFVKRQLPAARSLRDSIFLPAQAGPSLLLAQRCNRGSEPELALQEWLRVVTIHPEQRALVHHAKKSAIDLLKSTDRDEMANQIESLAGKILK